MPDHLRSREEHDEFSAGAFDDGGSPPLAWEAIGPFVRRERELVPLPHSLQILGLCGGCRRRPTRLGPEPAPVLISSILTVPEHDALLRRTDIQPAL